MGLVQKKGALLLALAAVLGALGLFAAKVQAADCKLPPEFFFFRWEPGSTQPGRWVTYRKSPATHAGEIFAESVRPATSRPPDEVRRLQQTCSEQKIQQGPRTGLKCASNTAWRYNSLDRIWVETCTYSVPAMGAAKETGTSTGTTAAPTR